MDIDLRPGMTAGMPRPGRREVCWLPIPSYELERLALGSRPRITPTRGAGDGIDPGDSDRLRAQVPPRSGLLREEGSSPVADSRQVPKRTSRRRIVGGSSRP